jgi:hypothetical protein
MDAYLHVLMPDLTAHDLRLDLALIYLYETRSLRQQQAAEKQETQHQRRHQYSVRSACVFGARRLSQQSYPFFPEPPKGAHPYIRTPKQLYSPKCVEGEFSEVRAAPIRSASSLGRLLG